VHSSPAFPELVGVVDWLDAAVVVMGGLDNVVLLVADTPEVLVVEMMGNTG